MRKSLMFIAVCGLLVGCTAAKRVEDFNKDYIAGVDNSQKIPNLPFQHSWASASLRQGRFKSIYVKPIDTSALRKADWKSSASLVIASQDDYLREAQELARYFRDQVVHELHTSPDARFHTAPAAGPGVAVIEISLIELEFSHPVARGAALVSPVIGANAAMSTMTEPHATFVLKIKDGATGEVVATAADRKFTPIRVIDLNKLTATSSVREICNLWAQEIGESINKGRFAQVDEKGRYEILPW